MLGGGNRGRGVGNEPSRSLRGSGVVARLLRSELSAEHFPCPGSRDTAHPSRTSEIARELPRGRRHHERFAPPSSREPDSPDCRLEALIMRLSRRLAMSGVRARSWCWACTVLWTIASVPSPG